LANLNFSKNLWEAFLQFVYPSFCLHCADPTRHGAGIFCLSCTSQLELINPLERCPYCFSADFDAERRICYPCFMEAPSFKRSAAVFDYQGPAATLVLKMKYAHQSYLADGAGAYLAMQFMQLDWPMPDLIVPVPLTLVHRISRGYNQSLLLAESLGKIINRPVQQILRRRSLDYSQAGMSKEQRLKLGSEAFSIKKHSDIRDKVILLVDDVMTTGQTMDCCAKVLYQGLPQAVYVISLCRA
jgi:ComF family protein